MTLPDWINPDRCPQFIAAWEAWQGRPHPNQSAAPCLISRQRFRQVISLRGGREITIGRGQECTVCRLDEQVDMQHCVVAQQPGGEAIWIADCGTATCTYVNRESVTVRELRSGDLIQVGPFAFAVNATDGFLVPVTGIQGASLRLVKLNIGRLRVDDLIIEAGKFTAITGPSGSGKSTLLKVLAGLPEFRGPGRVLADGCDITSEAEWYRTILGYLSQDAVVHSELSPLQALKINVRLRRSIPKDQRDPRQVLRQLEVPEGRWHSPFRQLSGGEQKRVRIATELIATPHLLLLDEPASGLDHELELGLMKLLKSLSIQGCTVVLVTHGDKHRGLCDRTITMQAGAIVADARSTAGPLLENIQPKQSVQTKRRFREASATFVNQFRFLFLREIFLSLSRWLPQSQTIATGWAGIFWRLSGTLVRPEVSSPILFAVALHLTLPGVSKREYLGFFSVLAAIWMGASLSLLSIADERPIFDHEQFLYLRITPYVLAKVVWLGFIGVVQAILFFAVLWLLHQLGGAEHELFYGSIWVLFALATLASAGVAMGLVVSAIARRNKEIATLLLPLIMIGQIVFSAQVCGDGGHLDRAYGTFHCGHRCNVWPRRRAEYWIPEYGGWICSSARHALLDRLEEQKKMGSELTKDEVLGELRLQPKQDPEDEVPRNVIASKLSYVTLSRYGDIILRSFAYDESAYQASIGVESPETKLPRLYDYSGWRQSAYRALVVFMVLYIVATIAILAWQNSNCQILSPALNSLHYLAQRIATKDQTNRIKHQPLWLWGGGIGCALVSLAIFLGWVTPRSEDSAKVEPAKSEDATKVEPPKSEDATKVEPATKLEKYCRFYLVTFAW